MEPRRTLVKEGEIARYFSQRAHVQDCSANSVRMHGAQPTHDAITSTDSLYFSDTGKKHFDAVYSKSEEGKPGKHKIPQKKSEEEMAPMKKAIVLKPSETIVPGHVRLFPEMLVRRSEVNDKMFETKRVVLCENGTPAKFRTSEEFRMEQYMNRKQRIRNVESQRNGIPIAVPGDKGYKDVTLSNHYYEDGGLIPGSTIALKNKTAIGKHRTETNSTTSTKKIIPYSEKAKKLAKEEELKDVHVLTV
jgi:hypothetical protein